MPQPTRGELRNQAAERIERLESDIRALRNAISSDVDTRKYHPTYGRTKKVMWADLHRLEGMVTAWLLVTGRWAHGGTVMFTREVKIDVLAVLNVNLDKLHDAVEES